MYYVVKQGVYIQGVYWIGGELQEAIDEAKKLADNDADDYHNWDVRLYEHASPDCSKPIESFNKGTDIAIEDKLQREQLK